MRARTSLFFLSALFGMGQAACGGVATTGSSEPPSEYIDEGGRKWLRSAEPAEFADALEGPMPTPRITEEVRQRHLRTTPPTVDELAQALRGKMLFMGYEYTLAEPDYDGAEAVLRGEYDERGSLSDYGNAERPVVGDGLIQKFNGIFGTDTRAAQRNNTTWPNSVMYLLFKASAWPNTADEGCSGTMIGASTLITAAHCVFEGDSQKFRENRGWAGGVDSRDANPFPFGATLGCYRVTVLGAYDAADDYEDDFAVIEFAPSPAPCGSALFPGNSTGWTGIWAAGTGTLENTSIPKILAGYPGEHCPPNGTDANCFHPTIWSGQDGYGDAEDFLGFDNDTVDHKVDATHGDSGAGLRIKSSSGPGCTTGSCDFVIGVHSGFVSPFIGSDYNVAVRTNGRILNFLEANSRWRRL
jgi:V8-like Glu-specific endopeptidase